MNPKPQIRFITTSQKLLASAAILLLLALQGYIVGRHDGLTLLLILLTTLIIWVMTASLWYSKRQILNLYLKDASFLQRLIKKRNTPWQILACTVLAVLLSILFVITTKGIILSHGYSVLFTALFAYNLIYKLARAEQRTVNFALIDNNLNEHLAKHGSLLLTIFMPALLLNLLLTLLFSGYDTAEFITSNINFENFIDYAERDSIMGNGHNPYGRKIVNAFLLLDKLRIALGKFIAQDLFHIYSYWLFYLIIAISNFMKLMFFSWAYILLLLGLEKLLPPYTNNPQQETP